MKIVKSLREFEYFTVFLKNRIFTSKIKKSKVTDYAALSWYVFCTQILNIIKFFMPLFLLFSALHY